MSDFRKPRGADAAPRRLFRSHRFEALEERLALTASPMLEFHSAIEQGLFTSPSPGEIDHHFPEDLLLDHGFPLPDLSDPRLLAGNGELPAAANVPLSAIPTLHSNPDATAAIYLDFDGHFESTWGAYSNITTPVYSSDADATTLTSTEIAAITEVWKRVSEDFSPFNIDVTTVDPGDFSNGTALRVAIGGNGTWTGGNYGGVAYPNSFTNYLVNTVYVFADNLGDVARYVAEATSHEVGHAFGLYHQSAYDGNGNKTGEYHPGNSGWAPIMGVSYSATQSLWHDGRNTYGSIQDDLAVLTNTQNDIGYRTDDHSNLLASGTVLTISNGQVAGSGIIEQMSDWDVFSLQVNKGGQVTLDVSVADIGANLDASVDLYDSNDQLIVTADPVNSLSASISQSLAAGQYTLVVRSSGDYGELGKYTINGSVPTNSAPQLASISDQILGLSDSLTIQLSATDVEGDLITYSAQAAQVDATSQLAFQLDQQRGFYAASAEFLNLRGAGEKYFQGGSGDWYFILADGRLYQWGSSISNSVLIATLDSDYHADLSLVHSTTGVLSTPLNSSVSVLGNTLTVAAPEGFMGDFTVTVTATDGMGTDVVTFDVSVVNHAPVLTAIGNRTMTPSQDSLVMTLSANDPDGDLTTFTAVASTADPVSQAAYEADQQYNFRAAASEYYNLRDAGEKYVQDGSGNWFFVLADGRLYRWGSTIANSTLVTTLDSSYHATLSKLYDVQAPQSSGEVAVSINGNQLTIDPADGFTGEFTVEVSVTDGVETDAESFVVSVVNHAPMLTSIGNQSMAPSHDTLVISLAAADVDGDSITFTARALQPDPIAQAAYNADQQHNLRVAPSEYDNLRGAGEKYLQGNGDNWYFILADGRLYQWGTSIADSTLVAKLNASYHADLSQLIDVQAPQQDADNVAISLDGNQLTIDPAEGFSGNFSVEVTASDGSATITETFTVSVVNHAPVLSIGDQVMSPNQDTLVLTLPANDSDGDAISFIAEVAQTDGVAQAAYEADQQYNFRAAPSEYHNYRGAGEKYLQDDGGNWFFILADGQLYQWGSSIAQSTLVASLDSSYYADLSKLFDVQAPQQGPATATVSFDGNQLTIDPTDGFLGEFTVTVTATDGTLSDIESFMVTVANQAPTLSPIDDQVMSADQDTLVISLSASDADGDVISISAQATQTNPITQAAYHADQQHNFTAAASEYYNYRGAGEKYCQGNGGAWYFILSDGSLYQWGTTVANSILLATLDSSYHADVSKLYNVQLPQSVAANVTLSVIGTQLTIDPADGYSGSFTVNVTATAGIASDTETFTVTVPSAAPSFGMTLASPSPAADSVSGQTGMPAITAEGAAARLQVTHQRASTFTTTPLLRQQVDTVFSSWEVGQNAVANQRLRPASPSRDLRLRYREMEGPEQHREADEWLAIESVLEEFAASHELGGDLTS